MINANGRGNIYSAAIGDRYGNPVAHHGMRVTCSDCWDTAQDGFGGPCVIRPTAPSSFDAPNKNLLQKPAFKGWKKIKARAHPFNWPTQGANSRFCLKRPLNLCIKK